MKAPQYDIYRQAGHKDDLASTSAGWAIAIFKLAYPISFDRKKMKAISKMPGQGAELRGKNPLIIVGDCITLNVNSTKDNHLGNLQATLKQSKDHNYMVEIVPGDWMMAWMVDDENKLPNLISRLKQGQFCNKFDDGLKFVGRVDSIFKDFNIDSSGHKTVSYTLNGVSFKELDTSLFYFHDLADLAYNSITTWMAKIGYDLRNLFMSKTPKTVTNDVKDNTEDIILGMFEILLGKGARKGQGSINTGQNNGLNVAYGGAVSENPIEATSNEGLAQKESNKEAPFAYVVPEMVGKILAKTSRSKEGGVLAYADLIEIISGRQEYSFDGETPYLKFEPDLTDPVGHQKKTGNPLLGSYIPLPVNFVNTPLWQFCMQFLNPAVNEMYATLRVNGEGYIVPTVIARQIPFTTDSFDDSDIKNSGEGRGVTRFTNLPQWVINKKMIKEGTRLGRSNATRFNFVHIGVRDNMMAGVSITQQLALNKPIFDNLDIQRSGLNPYYTTIGADVRSSAGKLPSFWMQLVADRVMNSHLSFNGNLKTIGIQAPICIGDNVLVDDVIFHIESISHNCSITNNGKLFETSLNLSYGLRDPNSRFSDSTVEETTKDVSDYDIYAGITMEDNVDLEPGTTDENVYNTNIDESENSDESNPKRIK